MKTLQKYLVSIIIWSICIVIARIIYSKELGTNELNIIGVVGIINFSYGVWVDGQYKR